MMAAPAQLTPGWVAAVSEYIDDDGMLQPVLQVVDVRKVPNPQRNPAAAERFRMVLSDGVHSVQSMLATAINPLVRDGAIKQGSVIHLQEFTCSTIQSRRIIIVIRLDVLQSECDIIGNPRPYVSPAPRVSLSQDISSVSRIYVQKTIAQIKDENLGRSDMPDLITVRAVISHVLADNFCYPACTLELNGKRCYRKVSNNGDGTWYCDRCNQRSDNCEYRYLLLCQIMDHTGTTFATAFEEAGEAIVGCTAHELFSIRNVHQDEAKFREIMDAMLWRKYLFKLRTMEETFNAEQHVKFNIVGVDKLDASAMSHHLLEEIDNLLKDFSDTTQEGASWHNPNVGCGLYHGMGKIVSVDKLDASDMSRCLLEEIDSLLKDFSDCSLEGASWYNPNVGYGLYHGLGSASPFRQ